MEIQYFKGRSTMTRVQEITVILVLAVVGIANLYDLAIDLSHG